MNWKKAAAGLLFALASAGVAQADVGRNSYDRGDIKSGLDYWRPLANKGNPAAQLKLGRMYEEGNGVEKNLTLALSWYKKAADQGNAEAQFNVGTMYDQGEGVTADKSQAIAWYKKAAAQGYLNAQYNLGVVYDTGQGVAQDKPQAFARASRPPTGRRSWVVAGACKGSQALAQLLMALS